MPQKGKPFIELSGPSGGTLLAVPSLHGRRRFASLVRQCFFARRPDAIAVELPATLEKTILQGVERLPYLSVVSYQDYNQELEMVRQILPITPEDSLIEAVRLGVENDIPVHFIDRDVLGHDPTPIKVLDDYLVDLMGLEEYYSRVLPIIQSQPNDPVSNDRELEMAVRVKNLLDQGQTVLLVCGMAHFAPIRNMLSPEAPGLPADIPPGGVTQREQTLYGLAQESFPYVLDSMPFLVFLYELSRRGLKNSDFPGLVPLPNTRGGERRAAVETYQESLSDAVEKLRQGATLGEALDDYDAFCDLVRGAVDLYSREWNEQPSTTRLSTLLRFARNLALVKETLVPSRFQLVLAAKNTVNDDFAYQMLRLADHYPFVEEESELPEMKIEGDGRGEADGESLVLKLRLPRDLQNSTQIDELDLEEPPEELEEGSWQDRWEEGYMHVSHIPQDYKLEDFFTYLRNKCRRIIADQEVRLHPLQASMMDGLDLRETLRNLPRGKIFVRENLPAYGEVGPVVVIFHQPGQEHEYPHEMMWYAEHEEESDLALYSTEPGKRFDGPGISRCQYGGLLSLFPPTGREFVWGNPRYEGHHSRAETLLKAAIDLSRKPIVTYAAVQGPTLEMQSLAASRGIRIMHIPLDSLSADLLKKIRTFHVLADRYIRPLAYKYIRG
ncbi:MAG: hypothetical protein OEZ59_02195 [Deltaproteobacteria bacterium]|nr:hypothetical protein [Deltaproteobacteria bacterium]